MVRILKRLLGKDDGNQQIIDALRENYMTELARGEALQDTEEDAAYRAQRAVKYDVLYDEDVLALLALATIRTEPRAKLTETGEIDWQRNHKGEVITDARGEPIPKYVPVQIIDRRFAALYNLASHIETLRFLDRSSKALARLTVKRVIHKIRCSLSEEELRSGYDVYLRSWEYKLYNAIDDSLDGRKLKTLLEISKKQRIEFSPEEKKKRLF